MASIIDYVRNTNYGSLNAKHQEKRLRKLAVPCYATLQILMIGLLLLLF